MTTADALGRYYQLSLDELAWMANSARHERIQANARRKALLSRKKRAPSVERACDELARLWGEIADTWKRELKLINEARRAPR